MLAIGCALAMLAAIAAIAPAFAGAQAAVDEYELGDLPNPDGDNATQTQSSGDESSGAAAPSSGSNTPSPPAAEPQAVDSTGAIVGAGSNEGDNQGQGNEGQGGSGKESRGDNVAATPAETEPVAAVDADSSDGGGAPVLLILLAIVAAVCTGVAMWRLRQDSDDTGKGVGPGTQKTAETQSL